MSVVTITVELTPLEAMDLAQFIKRVRHDQVLQLTEGHLSEAQRVDQAYRMLHAAERVAQSLRLEGYAPR